MSLKKLSVSRMGWDREFARDKALAPLRCDNKLLPMGTGTFVQDFKDGFEFTPVDGQPSLFVIHLRHSPVQLTQEKMTSEDWDQFEKSIKELRVR